MKNLLFIIFCAFSLFLAIYYYQKYSTTQQAIELANRRILDRDTEIYRLQKKVSAAPNTGNNTIGKLTPAEISRLQARGLQNPEADLKENLTQNQKSVLNHKGVLGGKMAIRDIQVLNEHYALAYFEDGHYGGYMVLRYEVKSGGNISWQPLDSYLI